MSKITYFCPNCWYSQKELFHICPACKADQSTYKQDTLDQKLINAISHPVEETRLMAIWLIGQRKVSDAWDILEQRLAEMGMSFYESRELLQTLNAINPQKAVPILQQTEKQHPSEMVRRVAHQILQKQKR